jgi:protein involved in temperature-dependent protein secretion
MPTPVTRRRSDRLSPRDQSLKEKLMRGTWTKRELEWVRDSDPRLPLVLASIIAGKLRSLEDITTP